MKALLPMLVVSLSCQSLASVCSTCSNYCSNRSPASSWCRCDSHCLFFQDCCTLDSRATLVPSKTATPCPPTHLTHLPPGVELQCVSAHADQTEALVKDTCDYFMVSSCPDSWIDPGGTNMREECSTPSGGQPSPPVTDATTGLVYRNEFCAQCNGVTRMIAWEVSLRCSFDQISYTSLEVLLQEDPDILTKRCWPCQFTPPQTNLSLGLMAPRPCRHTVRTCPPYSPQLRLSEKDYNQAKLQCQNGSLDPVKGIEKVYHNSACGLCNGESTKCLSGAKCTCHEYLKVEGISPTFSVSLTLKSLGQGSLSVSSGRGETATISIACPEGEVPVGLECRPTQCPEAYTQLGGLCSLDIISSPGASAPLNCSSSTFALGSSSYTRLGNNNVVLKWDNSTAEVLDYDSSGRPVICAGNLSLPSQTWNCSTALIALNHTEYEELSNNSILFLDTVLEIWFYDESNRPLVCPDHLPSSKPTALSYSSLPGISYLNYIGCFLSAIGSFLLLLTYCLFKELRTFPGLILMNLCAAILFNCLIYTLGSPLIKHFPLSELCTTMAITLHYSYLVQFAWLSIFSCEITRSFYLARKLSKESASTRKRLMLAYLVIAWIFPLVAIIILITLDFTTANLVQYGTGDVLVATECWINHYEAFLATFLVPLCFCLALNLCFFAITSVLIFLAYRDQTKLSKIKKSNPAVLARIWLVAFLLTGLSWVLGFLAHLEASWLWYVFTILNNTQGLALSLTFLLTRKVVQSYMELLGLKKPEGSRKTLTLMSNSSESKTKRFSLRNISSSFSSVNKA